MSVFHQWLLVGGSVALLSLSSSCLADEVPVSTCTQYLAASDNAFYSMVSSNNTTAANVAQTLAICSTNNVCSQISNVNSCAETLANRYFISVYFAAVNGNGASGGSFGASAPSSAGPMKSTNSTDSTATTAIIKTKPSKSDTSIHWF